MASQPLGTVESVPEEPPGALLAGLSPAQLEAVTSDAAVLCVVAGAGSGKTTVLTRRIAWRSATGAMDPEHGLVVTFTRKAGGELRRRLRRVGVGGIWAGTFHAAAYAQLRQHWSETGRRAPSVISDGRRVMRDVLEGESGRAGIGTEPTVVDAAAVDAVLAEAAWARARMIDPADYPASAQAAGRRSGLPLEQIAHFLRRFREEKQRRSVLDVDDLVGECTRILEHDAAMAAAIRWRFRHLFVDEFQDVNPAQWALLSQWRGGRDDLCVVGDPRQAVYAWNGSDPSLLGRLPSLLPGCTTLELDENRRSSPQIVAAATAVLADGDAPSGSVAGSAASACEDAPDGPVPVVTGFEDEPSEAAAVARWLRRTRRPGHPWHRHAVLARTNARLDTVAEGLRLAGIPVRRARRDAGAGATADVAGLLRGLDRDLPLRAAIVDALAEADGPGAPGDELAERLERLAEEYASDGGDDVRGPTVGGFLSWLTTVAGTADEQPTADGVELATFHRAKGLEWSAVAVVGVEDGMVPIVHATTAAGRAEERRLFYVALTRAERDLWCSWAARTGGPGAGRDRRPSPFVEAVRNAVSAVGPTGSELAVGHIAELRGRLTAAG